MKAPAHECLGPVVRPGSTPNVIAEYKSSAAFSPAGQDTGSAATDRQIILNLKTLFERDPALISSLMEDPERHPSTPCATTLMVAAREALDARPNSAELHYHVARAAARLGRPQEAASLLERALELNPCHSGASVLLNDVCMLLKEPHRAVAWVQRLLRADTAPPSTVSPGGRDRRGNELFT